MYTGTLPAPTANVGLPLEYAARTIPGPPVASTTETSGCRINSPVDWIVGSERHEMRPLGAPALTAASAMISAVRKHHRTARGWGAHTIALPDLTAARHLNRTVDVGFVTGIMAAMTPIGEPTAVMRLASSTHNTPMVRIGSIDAATNLVL